MGEGRVMGEGWGGRGQGWDWGEGRGRKRAGVVAGERAGRVEGRGYKRGRGGVGRVLW